MINRARVIAFYLPQFHPIPENDNWWGKGFTEWTNVGKAKPLFKGHYQPRVPADLGYYDLRVSESRKAQADLAREYGIEGFCYWHYWFGNGKRLLERPFNEVLSSKEPDFPFCLAWANESWKGFPHGLKNRNVLIEQLYPGIEDHVSHFYNVLPALKDSRYIKVNNKPLFYIYQPLLIPNVDEFIKLWQRLAKENGLEGIFFVSNFDDINKVSHIISLGFDAINLNRLFDFHKNKNTFFRKAKFKIKKMLFNIPNSYHYGKIFNSFSNNLDKSENIFPTIIPGWDHTPRSGIDGLVYTNSTPEFFGQHVENVLNIVEEKSEQKKIIFLKSWNEWAEGNYIEPDLKWGKKYLEVFKHHISLFNK